MPKFIKLDGGRVGSSSHGSGSATSVQGSSQPRAENKTEVCPTVNNRPEKSYFRIYVYLTFSLSPAYALSHACHVPSCHTLHVISRHARHTCHACHDTRHDTRHDTWHHTSAATFRLLHVSSAASSCLPRVTQDRNLLCAPTSTSLAAPKYRFRNKWRPSSGGAFDCRNVLSGTHFIWGYL